jgi:tetratricopeptide (TPR) repeat protein
MKTLLFYPITIIFTLLAVLNIKSQNISWSSSDAFSNTIITIQTTNNQQTRYNNALNFFSTTHATTKQLQDACFYLSSDIEKYNLCLTAYPNIIDKDNFINIYDSFSSFTNAIKLYKETQAKDELLAVKYNYQLNVEQDKNTKFDLLMQQGDLFLFDNKFDEAIKTYQEAMVLRPKNPKPNLKIEDALKWQKELSIISNEQNQNDIQYESLIQQGDHLLAYNLFNESIASYEKAMPLKAGDQTAYNRIKEANRRKKELNDLQKQEEIDVVEVFEIECITDDQKFSHIIESVEAKTFSDDMKEMARNQISKNCLSMNQFKNILGLFNMDDDKLEMLKFMYDHSENPQEMYLLREELSFSSSKKKYDDFLILKK